MAWRKTTVRYSSSRIWGVISQNNFFFRNNICFSHGLGVRTDRRFSELIHTHRHQPECQLVCLFDHLAPFQRLKVFIVAKRQRELARSCYFTAYRSMSRGVIWHPRPRSAAQVARHRVVRPSHVTYTLLFARVMFFFAQQDAREY